MSPTSNRLSLLRAVRELRTEFPRVVLVLAAGDLVASFALLALARWADRLTPGPSQVSWPG